MLNKEEAVKVVREILYEERAFDIDEVIAEINSKRDLAVEIVDAIYKEERAG